MAAPRIPYRDRPISITSPKTKDTVLPTFTAIGTFTAPTMTAPTIECKITKGGDTRTGTVMLNSPRPNIWQATFALVPEGEWTMTATRKIAGQDDQQDASTFVVKGNPDLLIFFPWAGMDITGGASGTLVVGYNKSPQNGLPSVWLESDGPGGITAVDILLAAQTTSSAPIEWTTRITDLPPKVYTLVAQLTAGGQTYTCRVPELMKS